MYTNGKQVHEKMLNITNQQEITNQNHNITSHLLEQQRLKKTRDLFKKIRDTKGILHTKMGTTKNRNSKGLSEGVRV